MERSVSHRGRVRRTAASSGSRTAGRCSTGTGTTEPTPGRSPTARITRWVRRSQTRAAKGSIGTFGPRPRAAWTSRAAGRATPEQGRAVAARLEREFLKPGGFVTTLIASGQQWDAPNGWPPLEWLTIEGVRRYGRADLADAARDRWLALNRRTYRSTGKMMEKYDVVDVRRSAGGGEYATQDGFGWSNGVALALAGQHR